MHFACVPSGRKVVGSGRHFRPAPPRSEAGWCKRVSPCLEIRLLDVWAGLIGAVLEEANAQKGAIVFTEEHSSKRVFPLLAKSFHGNHTISIQTRISRHLWGHILVRISSLDGAKDFGVRQTIARCGFAASGQRYARSEQEGYPHSQTLASSVDVRNVVVSGTAGFDLHKAKSCHQCQAGIGRVAQVPSGSSPRGRKAGAQPLPPAQ